MTAAYDDTVMPLVEGGSLYVLVGGDVINIILSYCDSFVHQLLCSYRAPKQNPLFVDQLTADFKLTRESTACSSAVTRFLIPAVETVTRLCTQMDTVTAFAESASHAAPARALDAPPPPRDGIPVWNSLTHAEQWLKDVAARLADAEHRVFELHVRERFRFVLRQYLERKEDAAPSSESEDGSTDTWTVPTLWTATSEAVARFLPAMMQTPRAPSIDINRLYLALNGANVSVQNRRGQDWLPASDRNDDSTLYNQLQVIARVGYGLAPVRVQVLCTTVHADDPNDDGNEPPPTATAGPVRYRHAYACAIQILPHDGLIHPKGEDTSNFKSAHKVLFRCRAIGELTRPVDSDDARPAGATPASTAASKGDGQTWSYYRTRDEKGFRFDDWKRGKSIPTVISAPSDIRTDTFRWSDEWLLSSLNTEAIPLLVDSERDTAAVYASMDATQWVNIFLLLASCAAGPALEWRAAFRALAEHPRIHTITEYDHDS